MIDETEFVTAMDIIADKIGIAATEIFDIFVSAQMTKGILTAICMGVVLTVGYLVYRKVVLTVMDVDKMSDIDKNDRDDLYTTAIPSAGVIALFVMLLLSLVVDILRTATLRVVCPEYMAITDIIRAIT